MILILVGIHLSQFYPKQPEMLFSLQALLEKSFKRFYVSNVEECIAHGKYALTLGGFWLPALIVVQKFLKTFPFHRMRDEGIQDFLIYEKTWNGVIDSTLCTGASIFTLLHMTFTMTYLSAPQTGPENFGKCAKMFWLFVCKVVWAEQSIQCLNFKYEHSGKW